MPGAYISAVCAFCVLSYLSVPRLTAALSPRGAFKSQVTYPADLPKLEDLTHTIASKETELFSVWLQYTYKQYTDIRVEYLGKVTKENVTIVSEVVFLDNGKREVRVIERKGRFSRLRMGAGVEEVMNNLLPFTLTEHELPNYSVEYLRSERLRKWSCHVFGVHPKQVEGGKAYFQGEIWVDRKSLLIVRTVGRPVPQTESSPYPEFDTVREVVDGKYLFPAQTVSNSLLEFPNGAVRFQQIIQYRNYKRFGSDVKIDFNPPK